MYYLKKNLKSYSNKGNMHDCLKMKLKMHRNVHLVKPLISVHKKDQTNLYPHSLTHQTNIYNTYDSN